VYTIVGAWDPHRTFTVATLQPWEERDISQMDLARRIMQELGDMPGAQVRIDQGNSLGVRGGTGGLQLAILGSEYPEIYLAAQTLSRALVDRIPEVGDVNISFDTSQPELFFNIDREKAND